MALGPTKLGRIWVKQQSAWGTAETSFADTDAIDAQGMFMPAGAQEALGQPTQRPVFGASDKKAGSKAGATAQLTFVLTHCADGSGGVLTTIEHKLIADAFGTLQQLAAIGAISGGTADQLLVASASADWIGQGAGVLLDNGNRQISWVQTVDTAPTPDEVNLPFDMEDTPGNSASASVTVVGNLLRRLRIDELPQLVAVLKGEMSLIGPRPERPEIEATLEEQIQHYRVRHWVRPGLSGWAQVCYPYGASVEDSRMKLSYDLYYLRNASLMLDTLILIKTIRLLARAKGTQPGLEQRGSIDSYKAMH